MIVNVKIISFYFANISSGNKTANINVKNCSVYNNTVRVT